MQQTLPDAPLDIIGDIHGELAALQALLYHLGYRDGRHPQGRRLVFVGDLCDRGPDSPGSIALVQGLVESGQAFAVMGNHELNLLRGDRKDGNNWFWDVINPDEDKFEPYRRVDPDQRERILAFLASLPLMLHREDLRIVHAAWDEDSVSRLMASSGDPLLALFDEWEADTDARLEETGLLAESEVEIRQWSQALTDADQSVPLLETKGRSDAFRQANNPIRVLTSGLEGLASDSFYRGGKWRFTQRVKWWDDYHSDIPVVIGHYWRPFYPAGPGGGDSDIFADLAPTDWHGARGNVFCADFCVGGRYQERRAGVTTYRTKLAALRWPERTLVLDSGEVVDSTRYRGQKNTVTP